MSDFIPNSYQTPNAYVDRTMAFLTSEEWKVLSYMARRIFGFNKREDHISLSQMENGLTDSNGNRLDYGTGLGRTALIKALKGLKKYRIALEVAPNDPRCNKGACYALCMDSEQVDWQGLEARWNESKSKGQKRTGKAREARAQNKDLALAEYELIADSLDSAVCGTYQQESGVSDRPHPVCGTDLTRSVGQTHNNQLEIQRKNSIRANDARQPSTQNVESPTNTTSSPKSRNTTPSQQSVLFEPQPLGGACEQAKQPRQRDVLWDAIAETWGSAPGMTAKLKQQLLGAIPKGKPGHESNLDVPATADEVREFAAWYAQHCRGCSMPTSPAKIQNQFYAFRREQAGKQQAGMDGFVFIPGLGYQQIAV